VLSYIGPEIVAHLVQNHAAKHDHSNPTQTQKPPARASKESSVKAFCIRYTNSLTTASSMLLRWFL